MADEKKILPTDQASSELPYHTAETEKIQAERAKKLEKDTPKT